VLAFLPFQHIGYTPMLIYLGKVTYQQAGEALAVQAVWIAALAVFGDWFWRVMARRITIHGG
jgi:ABC-2 type transport system permease protein